MLKDKIEKKKSFIQRDNFLAIISQKRLKSTRVNTQNSQVSL